MKKILSVILTLIILAMPTPHGDNMHIGFLILAIICSILGFAVFTGIVILAIKLTKTKIVLSLLFLLLMAQGAYGATVYVIPDTVNAGKIRYLADAFPTNSPETGTANKNIEDAHTAANTNGTLIIAAGTYTNTQLGATAYRFLTKKAGTLIRAATAALDSGVSGYSAEYAGSCVFDGAGQAVSTLYVYNANTTVTGITILAPGAANANLLIRETGFVGNDLTFLLGTGHVNSLSVDSNYASPTTAILNRCNFFAGNKWWGATANNNLTITFNYCKFRRCNLNTINGNGIFNHCLFWDFIGAILASSTNAGTVVWNNSMFFANADASGTQTVLTNTGASAWTINNSFTAYNPLATNIGYAGVTINSGFSAVGPRFVSPRYPAVVSFMMDDAVTLTDFQTLATKLEAYGWRGTFALPTTGFSNWAAINALIAAGHKIASHGTASANLTELTESQARAELVDSKAILEANLYANGVSGTPYSCTTFVHPGNQSNATIRGYVSDAGYSGSRGGSNSTDGIEAISLLSTGNNKFNTMSWNAWVRYAGSSQATTATVIGQAVTADILRLQNMTLNSDATQIGGIHIIYGHSLAAETTSDQWDAILAATYASGVQVMTLPDAISYALSFGGTVTDASNYHLLPGSPAIDAGADVGLTSDYGSKHVPQGSAPDIGAYEYQLTVTLTPP
jgi:hypothetical protein